MKGNNTLEKKKERFIIEDNKKSNIRLNYRTKIDRAELNLEVFELSSILNYLNST